MVKLENSNSSQQHKNICSFTKHLHLGLLFEITMKMKLKNIQEKVQFASNLFSGFLWILLPTLSWQHKHIFQYQRSNKPFDSHL